MSMWSRRPEIALLLRMVRRREIEAGKKIEEV